MSNRMLTLEEADARMGQICSRIPGFKEYKATGIEPMHDRVLVERIPEPERLITLTDAEKSKIARVLAVGPGRWIDGEFCKTAVKPGDVVIIPGAGGKWPDWEQQDTILVQEGDIGGILG